MKVKQQHKHSQDARIDGIGVYSTKPAQIYDMTSNCDQTNPERKPLGQYFNKKNDAATRKCVSGECVKLLSQGIMFENVKRMFA